jgi:hypothetical protein
MLGRLLLTSLLALLVESGEVVKELKNGVLAGTYRPISSQDAIDRRFNCVLRSFMATRRNCQFYLASDLLWAWLCSVLDRQDAINELRAIHLTQPYARCGGMKRGRLSAHVGGIRKAFCHRGGLPEVFDAAAVAEGISLSAVCGDPQLGDGARSD